MTQQFLDSNPYGEYTIVFASLFFLAAIFLHVFSKIQSFDFLRKHSDECNKMTSNNPDMYVNLAHEALEHYLNACNKSFSGKRVIANSKYFLLIIENCIVNLKKFDVSEKCTNEIISFSKNASFAKKIFEEMRWPETPKKIEYIFNALDTASQDMACLWQEKTNDYVY